MITKTAKALLRPPLTAIQTVDQARAAHLETGTPPPEDVPPDVAREVIHAHMDRHYCDSLDQPIPALTGNKPRQAVKTAVGRKLVREWLMLPETGTARAAE